MAALLDRSRTLRALVGRNGSKLACALFVLVVLLGAALDGSLPLAVYLLSFWHYYLYWLAFAFGAVPFDVFKRDAIAMKTVSILALAVVYLAVPLDLVSLGVMGCGVLLNMRAAAVLGIDRTYYGHEVLGLAPKRITAFPYSLTAHPMILGNVAAFGGTLINPAFVQDWWPLAGLHVALNIGLLVMELVGRGRVVRVGGGLVFAGLLVAAVFAVPLLGVAAVACAWILYRRYTQETGRETHRRSS